MPRTYRQRRGQKTAELVADYMQPIAPGCYATGSGVMGSDIKGVPWDMEVKAPSDVRARPGMALRQAAKRRKPEHVLPPMVVVRPDGTGEEHVGQFIVMRYFEDDRAVLEELLQLRWLKETYERDLAELRGKENDG